MCNTFCPTGLFTSPPPSPPPPPSAPFLSPAASIKCSQYNLGWALLRQIHGSMRKWFKQFNINFMYWGWKWVCCLVDNCIRYVKEIPARIWAGLPLGVKWPVSFSSPNHQYVMDIAIVTYVFIILEFEYWEISLKLGTQIG